MFDADYSFVGLLLESDPPEDHRWLFTLLGSLLGFMVAAVLAWFWNRRLRSEASRRTGELLEGQERFEQLSSATWEATVVHERGIVLEANELYYEMFGYEPEEVLGQECLSRTTTPESNEFIRRLIAAGHLGPYEATGKKKDGTEFPIEVRVRVMDHHGRQVRVVAIRDMTEQKKAVGALRESEANMRAFMENARGFGVYSIATAPDQPYGTRVIFTSPSIKDILGIEHPEDNASWFEHVHPDDLDRLTLAHHASRTTGKGFDETFRTYHPEKREWRWIHAISSQVTAPDETLTHFNGLIVDVTDVKQAEEELRASEERFRTLTDNIPGVVYLCRNDERYTMLYLNDEVEALTGYPREEFLANRVCFVELYHPEDTPGIVPVVDRALAERQPFHLIYRLRHRSGEWRWIEEWGTGLFRDGELKFLEGFLADITDRKQSEEERLSLERQVQHAQKLESLGVLAGGIAHDFNNILMAILGNADLALDELSPHSPARESIQEIEKSSKRAADLARQMLAYSGRGRLVIESIDLNEFVEEMAHLLEVSISKKAVLKYSFPENPPTIDGDPTQIRQIIMNLITNASEAIGERNGIIALSTGAIDCDRAYLDEVSETIRVGRDEPLPEGLYAYVEVEDTGCGMDAGTIEKVFDPFFTTKFTGRGLGMSAVLGIVRGHHGAIKVRSEVGVGTTFRVLLPASESPEGGVATRRADAARGEDWRGNGDILIADDEESVRAVGGKMLERMGFGVLAARDGHEAVTIFREHADEIVCVLLDLTMPHLDGEEAFREMRRIRSDVRVILCSGYSEQDATQPFAGKGLTGFLQKPYDTAALKEKIREVLDE